MPEKIWVIGDIHGYSLALARLLDNIAPQPEDTVVTLGDYIDRGPDTRGVVDRLMRLRGECRYVPLLGNHEDLMFQTLPVEFCEQAGLGRWYVEEMMFDPSFVKRCMKRLFKKNRQLELKKAWLGLGGVQTLTSYGCRSGSAMEIPLEHLRFLAGCQLFYETENAIFMHAGYAPHADMIRQPRSVLLNLRLNREVPPPHKSGKRAYVGHSAQRSGEILNLGHIVCVDTCLYGGGWLTALEVNSATVIQIDSGGMVKKEKLGIMNVE